jgi:hypothetical protein
MRHCPKLTAYSIPQSGEKVQYFHVFSFIIQILSQYPAPVDNKKLFLEVCSIRTAPIVFRMKRKQTALLAVAPLFFLPARDIISHYSGTIALEWLA